MKNTFASVSSLAPPIDLLELPDGGTAALRGEVLEVRDRKGRLLVRYVDGSAEICAATGDLRLSAPEGRVIVESGLDIEIEAGRDVVQRAGRHIDLCTAGTDAASQVRIAPTSVDVKTDRLAVTARSSRAVIGNAAIVAGVITTTAERIAASASHYEIVAERLVERSRDAYREVTELAQTQVGRARTIVEGVFSLTSRRTVMVSDDDTSIDASKILLG